MMELNHQTMKVESGEETFVGLKRELEGYRSKWKELEGKCEKFLIDTKGGLSDIESLASKFTSLETEKIMIENEVKVLKHRNVDLEMVISDFGKQKEAGAKSVVDLTDGEEDGVTQLMMENKVLECEKRAAESVVEDWKSNCRRLEMENSALRGGKILLNENFSDGLDVKSSVKHLQLDKAHHMGIGDSQEAGTPLNNIAIEVRKRVFPLEAATHHGRRVRKQLTFSEEVSTCKKMAPSTPGIAKPYPYGVVDISDGEDDQEHKTNVHLSRFGFLRNDTSKENGTGNSPYASTHKRKRASNIIDSDIESEDDEDNIPIGKLRNKHLLRELKDDVDDFNLNHEVKESLSPKRRLVRKYDKRVSERSSPDYSCENLKDKGVECEDETGSSNESESLGGFIVSGSDISESDASSSVPEEVSDNNVDFDEVISKIRRKRNKKVNWEFEADMLVDFAKDMKLCMKAVCALYRQQTAEEKCSKETIFLNQRGFSQCDAPRGSALAEFLCDGDPYEDVCKSMEELREYNPNGPELCRTLASHYSKQLFAVYKNEEDPLFLPS